MKNKSYIGISFIVLIFGIWAVKEYSSRYNTEELAYLEVENQNGKLIKTFPTYIQAHDYVKQNEDLEEAKIISDISGVGINVIKKEVIPFNVKVGRVGPGLDSDYEVEFT